MQIPGPPKFDNPVTPAEFQNVVRLGLDASDRRNSSAAGGFHVRQGDDLRPELFGESPNAKIRLAHLLALTGK